MSIIALILTNTLLNAFRDLNEANQFAIQKPSSFDQQCVTLKNYILYPDFIFDKLISIKAVLKG